MKKKIPNQNQKTKNEIKPKKRMRVQITKKKSYTKAKSKENEKYKQTSKQINYKAIFSLNWECIPNETKSNNLMINYLYAHKYHSNVQRNEIKIFNQ